jgi:lipopolysaccharide transport system permease protein
MYATPVIYPISAVPEEYQWIIQLNPLTPVVEGFRYAFLGAGTVNLASLLYSVACTIIVLIVGLLLFHRVEATFIDTV